MKKNLSLSLVAVAGLFAITSCNSNVQESPEYRSLQQRTDSLQQQVSAKEQEVEDVAATVNEIENNLTAIQKDQLSISTIKKEGQETSQKDRINEMIAGIDNYMEQNRQKMEKLEARAKKAGKKNAALQRLVENLRATIAQKETEITELRSTIEGLTTENTGLKDQVAQRDRSISSKDSALAARQRDIQERDTEIYTAYYIHGRRGELEKSGIIDRKGNFLSKTSQVSGRVDKTKFTAIDMRNQDDINLGITDRKNVISSHPSDSFYITKVGEETHLKITDYKKFWSLTKFLVVETK